MENLIAKLSLNSTQSQLKLRLRLALFPADPPTHPATRDSSVQDYLGSAFDSFETT